MKRISMGQIGLCFERKHEGGKNLKKAWGIKKQEDFEKPKMKNEEQRRGGIGDLKIKAASNYQEKKLLLCFSLIATQ